MTPLAAAQISISYERFTGLAYFHRFASISIRAMGSPIAFVIVFSSILLWLVAGPWFGWSDTYQISFMNALTILTMLVVVLQLYMQRITDAKQDEMIKGTPGASNRAMLLEERTAEDLQQIEEEHRQQRKDGDT